MNRRSFLERVGAVGAAGLLAGCNSHGPASAQRVLNLAERSNEKLERWLYDRAAVDRVPRGVTLSGDAFPRYWVSKSVPHWDAVAAGVWGLEIAGAVKRPLRLTLEELVRLPSVIQRANHYCVEGWTARAEWRGVRLSDLARLVEPLPDAGFVDFQSFDSGYHESWDLESAMHRQTLVVYAMDGRYLNAQQGAPARIHSPIKLGYKNTKYLTKVLFLPNKVGGYWSDQGYEWYGGV